jgi:hypothetical protein
MKNIMTTFFFFNSIYNKSERYCVFRKKTFCVYTQLEIRFVRMMISYMK